MLEKDIENLLAKHIGEFLPERGLVLIGRQMQLGGYRADLVFKDGPKSKLVMEIKRGLLMREAIGQIGVYYGLLRQANPSEEIHLMLVANIIPKEMAIFLKEKIGIESLEIPVSEINKVAEKYKYSFEDSLTPEQKTINRQIIKDFDIRLNRCHVWIFQANPQRFDILNALNDEKINEDVWLVNQHKKEIRQGDIGLIWMSGKEAGIYAVVDIISNPEFLMDSPDSSKYWVSDEDKQQTKLRIKYKFKIKFPDKPIYKQELKNIPELSHLSILNFFQGTNFPVTDEEWKIISAIIEKKFS
jgi:predicted RNA-binding protein with PUA-like domain